MNPPRLSIASQLRNYFERNPDEELTFAVVSIKLGCSKRRAVKAVYELVSLGMLESTHVIRRREKGIAREQWTK